MKSIYVPIIGDLGMMKTNEDAFYFSGGTIFHRGEKFHNDLNFIKDWQRDVYALGVMMI